MKKNILSAFTLMLGLTFMMSCNTTKSEDKQDTQEEQQQKPANLVGGDRDDHGCIGSAGYKWSELLKDCIRPFEKGIKLGTAADSESTSATYLVFNSDSSRIEAFVPGEEIPPVLKKEANADEEIWKSEDDRLYSVKRPDGKWTIYQDGKWLYSL